MQQLRSSRCLPPDDPTGVCHAGHTAHYHHTDGRTSVDDVMNANPKPITYFHDGCHVSDFAAGGGRSFLGGAYVFNESPTALLCLSGSRSGQWLGLMARVMYESMAENTCCFLLQDALKPIAASQCPIIPPVLCT